MWVISRPVEIIIVECEISAYKTIMIFVFIYFLWQPQFLHGTWFASRTCRRATRKFWSTANLRKRHTNTFPVFHLLIRGDTPERTKERKSDIKNHTSKDQQATNIHTIYYLSGQYMKYLEKPLNFDSDKCFVNKSATLASVGTQTGSTDPLLIPEYLLSFFHYLFCSNYSVLSCVAM